MRSARAHILSSVRRHQLGALMTAGNEFVSVADRKEARQRVASYQAILRQLARSLIGYGCEGR